MVPSFCTAKFYVAVNNVKTYTWCNSITVWPGSSITLKLLIAAHKNLLKLILTSVLRYIPKNSKIWKQKKLSQNHAFLFFFPVNLDSFIRNWWQNHKYTLRSDEYIQRNISCEKYQKWRKKFLYSTFTDVCSSPWYENKKVRRIQTSQVFLGHRSSSRTLTFQKEIFASMI